MYNDYIYLDGKLFTYIERKESKFGVNSKVDRSLNNTGHSDRIGSRKHKFTFTFDQDSRGNERLDKIFDINHSFILIDWDSVQYTVIIVNDYNPVFDGENFSLQVDLEEL